MSEIALWLLDAPYITDSSGQGLWGREMIPMRTAIPARQRKAIPVPSLPKKHWRRPVPTEDNTGVSTPAIFELTERIKVRRGIANIAPECAEIADAAASDAIATVSRSNLGGAPRVIFSDDGLLTLAMAARGIWGSFDICGRRRGFRLL